MTQNETHQKLFSGIREIKRWFNEKDFLETPVPPMVENPGIEAHLHPFQVKSIQQQKDLPLYLHTSPEFYMKKLLSEGFEKIYCLEYCFRDEPKSLTHRPQFLMLEWYRANQDYLAIMNDIESLYQRLHGNKIVERRSVDSLFQEVLGFSILDFLSPKDLKKKIKYDFKDFYSEDIILWEDLFFQLFLNLIEPELKKFPFITLYEFPLPLAALSQLNPDEPRTCLRFESYLNGLEVANCFQELKDPHILEERIREESSKKKELYAYQLPYPQVLMEATKKLPFSSGIALGVERFLGGDSSPLFF